MIAKWNILKSHRDVDCFYKVLTILQKILSFGEHMIFIIILMDICLMN